MPGFVMRRPRLVLADEHTLVLEGLEYILRSDFDIVGVARDGRALVDLASRQQPDVVVTEATLPLLNGIEAVKRIRKRRPGIHAVFVTRHADREHLNEALRAGASGYLVKDCSGSEVIAALREVLRGRSYITPLMTADLFSSFRESLRANPRRDLTERQREVLQLVVEGHSLKDIAAILQISRKTVEFHKYGLMQMLGVRTNLQLLQYAIDAGLTQPAGPSRGKMRTPRLSNK
jgi:DNA-binding NarL/FixJ family response regulator